MNEFLANLGGSWRQLLIYPGGVTLLFVVLGTHQLWASTRFEDRSRLWTGGWWQLATVWLVCALLPWPRTYWAYPLDGLTALVLLEAPHWFDVQHQRHAADPATQQQAQARIVAALNVYPLLAIALGILAQASGSLLLPTIHMEHGWLRWAGVALWAIALPPLLDLGPWRQAMKPKLATTARQVGHVALLAVLSLPARDDLGYGVAALALTLTLGSLGVLDWLWRGSPQRWERWQPFLACVALALLGWTAVQDLLARMR